MNPDRVIAVRNSKIVYRDGQDCIKVFDKDYKGSEVLYEALNQARLWESGLRVPQVRAVLQEEGKWRIVSEYIPGKTMERRMIEEPEKREEYLAMLAELQWQTQTRTCPSLISLRMHLKEKLHQVELDAVTRYDLLARLEATPLHHKVCHGDFNPSNIILTDEGKPYILDWSHAAQGNGSADAATTWLWFRMNGSAEDAESYLELYCGQSGVENAYVRSWIPILAAALSVKAPESKREQLLRLAAQSDD